VYVCSKLLRGSLTTAATPTMAVAMATVFAHAVKCHVPFLGEVGEVVT